VSASIVRKALYYVGFYSGIAQKKPSLSDTHRARRPEFAREHQKWTIGDRKKVIWINESTLRLASLLIKFWFGKRVMNATN
jgi:hypothetical protein